MSALRATLRPYVPQSVRAHVAQLRRRVRDARNGKICRIVDAKPSPDATRAFNVELTIEQPIRQTTHAAGKIENLRVAAARLSHVIVPVNHVLSFWLQIGPPRASNGFRLGRSLIDDTISADIGGGLCQISGLLYELGLRSGFAVVERHAHSRDLYTEETRFTPLGLDATVVWGFKDLRLRNTLHVPVAFDFAVDDHRITGRVLAPQPVLMAAIRLVRTEIDARKRAAQVYRIAPHAPEQMISSNVYTIDTA
jgi:vancomycin resistance protein VanW